MALQYVGGKTGQWSFGAQTVSLSGLTGGLASSPSENDIVIVAFGASSSGDRVIGITSAGWTEDYEARANDIRDANLSVSYKIMGATPDTSFDTSSTGASDSAGAVAIHVWRGVDTTTPLDVASVSASGINGGQPDPGPITPGTSGAVILAMGCGASGSTNASLTSSDLSNFITTSQNNTYAVCVGMGSHAWTSGAFDPAAFGGGTTGVDDSWLALTMALRPAAGGTPAGLATEADTALALAAVQVRAAGLVIETDTALALTAVQIAPTGLSIETDIALALGGVHILAAGLATEMDAALGLSPVQVRAAGLSIETDIALALDPASGLGVGIAIETDSALAPGGVHILAAGLATEMDAALALTPVQVRAAGLASETDEALAPGGVHILAAGIAIEVDAALALVAVAASGPPRRTVIPPGRAIQPGRPGQTTYRRPPNISRG